MKRILLALCSLFVLTLGHAQFVDFGEDYDIHKGDFAVGDIDDDGDLDIIFSGENNGGVEKGAIMINDGSGTFSLQTDERVIKMGKSGNIKFGDIDGDGDLDVIFAGWGTSENSVGMALNDGSGVYTLANTDDYPINTAATVTSAGFADFNLDGLLDYYYFANDSGNCVLYFHQPDGSFEASTESFGGAKFVEPEVTLVDFDRDGYVDIFITAFDKITDTRFSALYKNDGFGVFTQFEGVDIYRKKANGTSSWGDINGDGYMDLMLNGDGWLNSGEDNDGMVRIYKNLNGLSTSVGMELEWYRQNGVGNGSQIVDWDNDGKLDFFIGGWNGSKQEIALYLGDDPANFTFIKSGLSETYFPGISEQGFRVADLNDDNKVDLLICGYSGGTMELNRRMAGYALNQSATASVAPSAPTNLNAAIDNSDGLMITFTWDAPTSESGKYGTTYNLSLKNTTTGKWLYNPMAVIGGEKNGWRKVAGRAGNVFNNTHYELYDLPDGNYEWTVQAINGSYLGGAFAATKTFTVGSVAVQKVLTGIRINATQNVLNVQNNSGKNIDVKVYTVEGKLIHQEVAEQNVSVQLEHGIYIVQVSQGKERINRKVKL
ncbi:FG-GAP-like repeat-containing protein [Saccharicrinis sp. FJH62]|uniref:FG-GAP-like repeat-containing protein n=1 Tax=Saccharicrinis sp. FJH62 TaxID=3344657 RepID=UPI0035D4D782